MRSKKLQPVLDSQLHARALPQEISIKSFHKQTIEEYAETISRLYDIEYSQLSAGDFSAQSTMVDLGGVKLTKRSAEQKFVCQGHASADVTIFTFPLQDTPFFANSVLYDERKQEIMLPSSEAHKIIPANLELLYIQINTDSLKKHLSPQELEIFTSTINKIEFLQVCTVYKRAATHFMHHLFREIIVEAQTGSGPGSDETLSADSYCRLIILFLYQYVHYHSGHDSTGSSTNYGKIVSRGLRFIEANPAQAIDLDTLSKNVYASRRAIQYAFSELTGLSPIQYIKTSKMNRIRKQLLDADHRVSNISDVLNTWHISNFGRFSAEYRELFNEGPKETIARKVSF